MNLEAVETESDVNNAKELKSIVTIMPLNSFISRTAFHKCQAA